MMRPGIEGGLDCGPASITANTRWKLVAAAIAMAALSVPWIVAAHAGLVKSIPGSRASLSHAPDQIELCFNEDVELKFSSVGLLAPDGNAVALGALTFGPTGPRCVVAPVPSSAMQPGTYTVKYKVLSQDGHVVEYGYMFTLRPASGE